MKIKKGDIIIVIILLAAVGIWLYTSYLSGKAAIESLVIEVNGTIYKKISVNELSEEQHIHIELEDGKYIDIVANQAGTWVEDVVCPDKLCQKTGVISKAGQSIVCLPNKVVIFYEGNTKSGIDSVAY